MVEAMRQELDRLCMAYAKDQSLRTNFLPGTADSLWQLPCKLPLSSILDSELDALSRE